MLRSLMSAVGAAALCFATAAHADDDLWRSQLEVGSYDVFHHANSEAFDLQIRPGWRLWDFGVFAGGMVTTKSALYGYGGFTLDVHLTDNIVIKADEAVGYYSRGHDKQLAIGSPAEFRSGIGVAYEFDNGWQLGAAIHHISNAGPPHVTRLTVTGHTDTVGSDAYNMRLSRRRALSVQKELVRDGVPAGEIAIFAKGKRELLVPTADGVKEPQNRRVQIVLE